MQGSQGETPLSAAVQLSWERCARDHKLDHDANHPILRLQRSEIAPRREALHDQIGGHHGILSKLASVALAAGHCLVLADMDGIVVRLETQQGEPDWNGIALGSVWDERVAGTNGVSLALCEGQDVTVRGNEHFYARLKRYICSGVPLRNASNDVIGVASLSSLDGGKPGDGVLARQLLSAAANRIQRTLFLRDFKDAAIVSVVVPGRQELIKWPELVAVNEAGKIISATSAAHRVSGVSTHAELMGRPFDHVFGTDLRSLDHVPGRVMSVRRKKGPLLDVWRRTPVADTKVFPGFRPKPPPPTRRNLPPTFKRLAAGSQVMAAICERAKASFDQQIPLLVEGETGTGKSMLTQVLLQHCPDIAILDCAALSDTFDDRGYVHSLFEQARIAGGLEQGSAIVFDNVAEMPAFAQNMFRCLLEEAESSAETSVHVLSTSRTPLQQAVVDGTFRDDLYYLISAMHVALPPVRARDQPDVLAQSVADGIANQRVEITPEAHRVIRAYDWPGNVREMRNVMRQALLQGDGHRISPLDLAIAQTESNRPRKLARLHVGDEEAIIRDALKAAHWNVSKAARTLGMGRATIHRKMKAFGISRPT